VDELDVVQNKMNSARITRGCTSGGAMLTKSAVFSASAAFHFWWALSESRWLPAISGLIFLGVGVQNLITWTSYRRGRWQIEWDGCHVRIRNGDHIDYDRDVSGIHQVEQDGRGYFIYPTRDTVFRLRRGQSSDSFEALLDNRQEAQ
jgi:hypothetical protein